MKRSKGKGVGNAQKSFLKSDLGCQSWSYVGLAWLGRKEMKRNKKGIYKDRRSLASFHLEKVMGGLLLVPQLVLSSTTFLNPFVPPTPTPRPDVPCRSRMPSRTASVLAPYTGSSGDRRCPCKVMTALCRNGDASVPICKGFHKHHSES